MENQELTVSPLKIEMIPSVKLIDISTPKYPKTFAMVDAADFDRMNQWRWRRHSKTGPYAARTTTKPRRSFLMHRAIMRPEAGQDVDHINGNGLDNRRENLRVCTRQQNACNRRKQTPRSGSRYKGVIWDSHLKKYRARITVQTKRICLGRYKTEDEAAGAYNRASQKYHGDFSQINQIGT